MAGQFPVISHQLSGVHQLRRSSYVGLVVGLLAALWGSSGLAQSGMFAMSQVWNLPGPDRPGYWQRLGRAGLLPARARCRCGRHDAADQLRNVRQQLSLADSGGRAPRRGRQRGDVHHWLPRPDPKTVPIRQLLPGAILAGLGWTVLLAIGTQLVHHYLHSDSVYGIFAIVLSLVAWIYLIVEITIYAAEVNVVLARRLWPRSVVQPPLTRADRHALALQPLAEQRRDEQQVAVSYADLPNSNQRPVGGSDAATG